MATGIMEVLLVNAKNLEDTDFLGHMDPYVLIQYIGQEHKSSVARGQGGSSVWNEKFSFRAEYLKIMDKDTFSHDDFVGQATVYVEDLLVLGAENGTAEMHPIKYSVVGKDNTYRGEIQVGVTFYPEGGRGK